MSTRTFIDTNVFIYGDQPAEGQKHLHAKRLIKRHVEARTAVISTQVLQEYFNTAIGKLKMLPERARWRVENMSHLDVVLVDAAIVLGAIDLHRLHHISIWDALVIKAASVANCSTVLTEDMNHGQIIDGVRIENPFLPAGAAAEPRARYQVMPEIQFVEDPRSVTGPARAVVEPKAKSTSSKRSTSQRGSARAR